MWKRRTHPGPTAAHWWTADAANSLCGLVTSAGVWVPSGDRSGCGKCEERLARSAAMMSKLGLAPRSIPKPREIAASIGIEAGCGDNSCLWGSPGGMATNGGCWCAERGTSHVDLRRELQKALKVVRHLAEKIDALESNNGR